MSDEPLLSVRDLSVGFVAGRQMLTAVSGVSFDLAAGDWLAQLRDWAADRSDRTARVVAKLLALPVWAPAFAVGIPLGWLTRERR